MENASTVPEVESMLQTSLDEPWNTDSDSSQVTVQAGELPVWGRVEPRRDGSFVVTGYRDSEWNGRQVSIPCLYSQFTTEEPAIRQLTEFCSSQANRSEFRINFETASIESVLDLVAETPTVFAATPEDYLARGIFSLVYHTPAGTSGTPVRDELDRIEAVTIGGQPFPLRYTHALHPEAHYYRRVPLYSEGGYYGLEHVSRTEGVHRVREFVKDNVDPTPLPSRTVGAQSLLWELVDAGATAITVQPEISNSDTLAFQVWMPPKEGYKAVGSYKEVNINDSIFELNWEFRCVGGPSLFERIPVYVDKDLTGEDSVSVTKGLDNLRAYLEAGCSEMTSDFRGGERDE